MRLTGVVPVTLLLGAAGGGGGVLVVTACPVAFTATCVPALLHTAHTSWVISFQGCKAMGLRFSQPNGKAGQAMAGLLQLPPPNKLLTTQQLMTGTALVTCYRCEQGLQVV